MPCTPRSATPGQILRPVWFVGERPWCRNIVLVVLTGCGQQDDRRGSQEEGYDDHLVKPVDLLALE